MVRVVSFRRSALHPELGGACAVARSITMALLLGALLTLAPAPARSASPLNAGNPDAKRLYDDLLSNYNKLVRPVVNATDRLTVRIKLKLSQLIDVVSVHRFTVEREAAPLFLIPRLFAPNKHGGRSR